MMNKVYLTVFGALVLTITAEAQYVYTNSMWLDGEMQNAEYVKGSSSQNTYTFVAETGTERFVVTVPKGREVTQWSWGTMNPSLASVNGAYENVEPNNHNDYYDWTGKKSPATVVYLAVHLDPLKYQIEFNGNGATNGARMESLEAVYTTGVTLPPNAFRRTGYTFAGWSLSASGAKNCEDAAVVKGDDFPELDYKNKLVTLYAVWVPLTVNATFDAQGGTFADGQARKVLAQVFDAIYVLPENPERPGYDFEAWTNATLTLTATTLVKAEGTVEFGAKWKAWSPFTIMWEPIADDAKAGGTITFQGEKTYGSEAILTANENPGSLFNGWSKGGNPEIVSYDKVYHFTVTESATYYAHFGLTRCAVVFHYKNASGEDVESPVQMVPYGTSATPPETPAYPEHRFAKWNTTSWQAVTGERLDVYAEYVSTVHTVRFEPNGENGDAEVSPATKSFVLGERFEGLPVPTRYGYDFAGWWSEAKYGNLIDETTEVKDASPSVLYAHWTPKKVTVTFNANGGIAPTHSSMTATFGDYYPFWGSSTRRGYELVGWFSPDGAAVTTDKRVRIDEDHEVKAKWQATTFKVTLNANGGEVSPTRVEVTFDDDYPELPTPARKGFDFTGWKTPDDKIVAPGDVVEIVEGDTLTASWEAIVRTLTLDPQGGELAEAEKTREIRWGEYYTDLPVPTREGYRFDGWYTAATGGTEVGNWVSFEHESDQTIYARWTAKKYWIYFSANGGTGSTPSQEMTWDVAQPLSANGCTRKNYEFLGWSKTNTATAPDYGDQQSVSNLTKESSLTLYAVWKAQVYTVVFESGIPDGEVTPMADQQIPVGEETELAANDYVREGYSFAGWRTADGKVFADKAKVTGLGKSGDRVTLTGTWRAHAYTVRFYPNGGIGAPYDQSFTYDVEQGLLSNRFTNKEANFDGWATEPLEAKVHNDQAKVTNLAAEDGVIVPLFAKWKVETEEMTDYSVAADCAETVQNERMALRLTAEGVEASECVVVSQAVEALKGPSYVKLQPMGEDEMPHTVVLAAKLKGRGTLTFSYRVKIEYPGDGHSFYVEAKGQGGGKTKIVPVVESSVSTWTSAPSYVKTTDEEEVVEWCMTVIYPSDGDYALIDDVCWKPEKWESGSYGVTYRLNDGTQAPFDIYTNTTCQAGEALGVLPEPERAGFTLLGWATEPTATEADVTAATKPTQDVIYYAVWKASANPEPTEDDRPVITADYSFATDARFDYVIWTTESLENGGVWTPGEPVMGDGKAVRLPGWPGDAAAVGGSRYGEVPQRFYKVEVRQRK